MGQRPEQTPRQEDIQVTLVRMAITKSLQITNAGEDVEERGHSYTVGGNVSWYSHYRKQYGCSSEN